MCKDYDYWNNLKKRLEQKNEIPYFYEREIWWCAIGINLGVEINGKHTLCERPVLIVKRFNRYMFWALPLTSHQRLGPFYSEILHGSGKSWAIISQLRLLSSKRLIRKLGMVSKYNFNLVQNHIIGTIKIELPVKGALGGRSL